MISITTLESINTTSCHFHGQSVAHRASSMLDSFQVLNTPLEAVSTPESHVVFLCPDFVNYGRVACILKKNRKIKDAGRLLAVFKYPTTPLNIGVMNNLEGYKYAR